MTRRLRRGEAFELYPNAKISRTSDVLEVRFIQLAGDPHPRYMEQTARQLRRAPDRSMYLAGGHLMRAAASLRGGNLRRAEQHFQGAWAELQRLRLRSDRLSAALRIASRAVKDITGAGTPLTGGDVHTEAAGGSRGRRGDDPTYGVVGTPRRT